jgi:hypothetical protein
MLADCPMGCRCAGSKVRYNQSDDDDYGDDDYYNDDDDDNHNMMILCKCSQTVRWGVVMRSTRYMNEYVHTYSYICKCI